MGSRRRRKGRERVSGRYERSREGVFGKKESIYGGGRGGYLFEGN